MATDVYSAPTMLFSNKKASPWTLLLGTILLPSLAANHNCLSPQYFDINTRGIVTCSFDDDYYGIYWYDTANAESTTPFISYEEDNGKRGSGLLSGEFDLLPNGSLVIRSVSSQHERSYRVLMLTTKYGGTPEIELVDVYLKVRPQEDRPYIAGCDEQPICFKMVQPDDRIDCTITEARPAVNLNWVSRVANSDSEIPSHTDIIQTSTLYNTSSTITLTSEMFQNVSLVLLVCQAQNPWKLLEREEALLLAIYSAKDLSSITPVTKKYVPYQEETMLACPNGSLSFFIWKRKLPNSRDSVIFYDLFDRKMSEEHLSENYRIDKNGSLIIAKTDVDQEGLYGCFTSDGAKQEDQVYDVKGYVLPTPNFPVVEGCNAKQHCTLEIEQSGTLTCTLQGVRPLVDLEWRAFPQSSPHIVFSDEKVTITNDGITFDVSLSVHYKLNHGVQKQITAECKAMTSDSGLNGLATKVYLLPVTVYEHESSTATTRLEGTDYVQERDYTIGNAVTVALIVTICLLFVTAVVILVNILKEKKSQKSTKEPLGNEEEGQPVLQQESKIKMEDRTNEDYSENNDSGKFKKLVKQLKTKYERIYKSVQPLPYLKDRMYCVNDLFVQLGMKHLSRIGSKKASDTWTQLSSYKDIFTLTEESLKRILIEGDPGYGKSTLTTQLLYEWCNNSKDGCLQQFHILILLHLRQLKGKLSIEQAIKSILLTKDTELTDEDIKNILHENKSSLCFVLDGFDEYPLYSSKEETDIKSIIQGDMFNESLAIITTRTNILPPNIPPQTVRIRLSGFDNETRNEYTQKTIFNTGEKARENIQEKLRGNPILGDLCEVPLFFAIFAHMALRGEDMEKLNTVTRFFGFMIKCFDRHLKNKINDDEEEKAVEGVPSKSNLETIAYESLLQSEQTNSWNQKDLCQMIGEKEYRKCIRIGILVEEEAEVNFEDVLSEIDEESDKVKVRFYHKLFCEWYAAKHLSKIASEGNKTDVRKELEQIDCNNLQYVYRFACGLDKKAAERIVNFLDESNVSDHFTILCINEEPELLETMRDTVATLCSSPLILDGNNDSFLQRCLAQFLHVASKQKIPIHSVWIRNAFRSFETERNCLLLNNGVSLYNLGTLRELHFHEENQKIEGEAMAAIIEYAKTCCALTTLWFHLCLLPFSLDSKLFNTGLHLQMQVIWSPTSSRGYTLNLSSGLWQGRDGSELTTNIYRREEQKWKSAHSTNEQG